MSYAALLIAAPQIILGLIALGMAFKAHGDASKIHQVQRRMAQGLCAFTHAAVLVLAAFILIKIYWVLSQSAAYSPPAATLLGQTWDFIVLICMMSWAQRVSSVARQIIEDAAKAEHEKKTPCRPCPLRGEGGFEDLVIVPFCTEGSCCREHESESDSGD